MRTAGSPDVLEYRRCLAVQRLAEGYSPQEVADFLGVDPSSVRRWQAAFRRHGRDALGARPVPGRPPKRTTTQEKIVRRWLSDCPTEPGVAHHDLARQRERTVPGVTTVAGVYGITSLRPTAAAAARRWRRVRDPWRIENCLPDVRDVTRGEDAGRVRNGSAPQVRAA